jgi:hypothetical protein
MEEGLVPLVVLHGARTPTLDWAARLQENRNRSSHFNIFPTLLQVMGYAPEAVERVYGRPLTVPTNDPFTFNVRFNARLGTPPLWRHIDLQQIVTPPPDADDEEPAKGPPERGRRPPKT